MRVRIDIGDITLGAQVTPEEDNGNVRGEALQERYGDDITIRVVPSRYELFSCSPDWPRPGFLLNRP